MFIMSLAIADLIVGSIVMPISSAYAITGEFFFFSSLFSSFITTFLFIYLYIMMSFWSSDLCPLKKIANPSPLSPPFFSFLFFFFSFLKTPFKKRLRQRKYWPCPCSLSLSLSLSLSFLVIFINRFSFPFRFLFFFLRGLEVWLHCVPVLVVSWLHGIHRFHLQSVHPVVGSILVNHVAAAILETKNETESADHDCAGLDRRLHVDHSHSRMEILHLWRATSTKR